MKTKKVIYYSDELNDDFAGNNIDTKKVEPNFKYIHKSIFWRILVFIFYRLIATPVAWFTCHILYGTKIYNRKALKKIKGGAFIYGNHTQSAYDAFVPSLVSFPKRNLVVAGPDAFSIKGIKWLVQIMGGIPVPGELSNFKGYMEGLSYYLSQKNTITVYPEAHIWPYYSGVRHFRADSFYPAAKLNTPIICFAVTYRERKIFKNMSPRIDLYVSDPIYPDSSMSTRDCANYLRDKAYEFMKEKTSLPGNVEYYKYIKEEKNKE